jgi:acetyltransferase-like isoleucine patch superfamily enzyme
VNSERSHTDFGSWSEKITQFRSAGARIGEKVRLIGDLDTVNPHMIEIGDYSVIGKGSTLLTHCPVKGARAIKIGSFVYIGFGAIVLPGVALGDFCVVGAGAVVTRSAPARSILAGNPARVLRMLSEQEVQRTRNTLLEGRTFADNQQPSRASIVAS